MKIAKLPIIVLFVLFFSAYAVVQAQTSAKLFTVNSTADTADAVPGDRTCADASGQCTLRAAVQEANANTFGPDIIIFAMQWPTIINLASELTITGTNFSIVGPGARRLTVQRSVDATTPSRIFHIPNSASNIVIRGLTIKNGVAGVLLAGGGVRIGAGASVVLTEIAILNNSAGSGGAISNAGNLIMTRSLIASNTCEFAGGGIDNLEDSSARITNTTITQNQAPIGGAIWNGGSMLLVNNTITHNSATDIARSIFSDPLGTVRVLNTIIGSDNASSATSLWGTFTSLGNNIVTDARTSTGFTNGTNNDQVSDNNTINPLLGNLANNGGQTDTRALMTGSPAINAGNNCVWNVNCTLPPGPPLRLFYDQRIPYIRQSGGTVDIGAFESGSNPVTGTGNFTGQFLSSPARYLGSIVILTNVETNEKTYAVMNPAGAFRFRNFLPGVTYIQEIKSKRDLPIAGPQILPRLD